MITSPISVALLRQPHRAAEWQNELANHGYDVIVRPVTRTRFIRPACPECWLKAVEISDWIAFTSVNAVEALFAGLDGIVDLNELLGSRHVAALAPASSQRLLERAVRPELSVSGTSSNLGRTIVEHLRDHPSVLHPCARAGLRGWLRLLQAAGHRVRRLPVYVTEPIPLAQRAAIDWNHVAVAVVAAPSAVHAVLLDPELPARLPFVAIGPTTARAVQECKLRLLGSAAAPSARAVAELLDKTLKPARSQGRVEGMRGCTSYVP